MGRADIALRFAAGATALAACARATPVETAPSAPPAPVLAPSSADAAPSVDAPSPPREIPEHIRIPGDRSRTVFVVSASDLIWPAKGPVDGRIDLEGRTIWSGEIRRSDVQPDVLPIELAAPLPTTGTLHVTIVVGERRYDVETAARTGEFLEIRGGTRGPSLGWNPGYKYK
jgi:hypothetical protein